MLISILLCLPLIFFFFFLSSFCRLDFFLVPIYHSHFEVICSFPLTQGSSAAHKNLKGVCWPTRVEGFGVTEGFGNSEDPVVQVKKK
jgi:hypothetical protein